MSSYKRLKTIYHMEKRAYMPAAELLGLLGGGALLGTGLYSLPSIYRQWSGTKSTTNTNTHTINTRQSNNMTATDFLKQRIGKWLDDPNEFGKDSIRLTDALNAANENLNNTLDRYYNTLARTKRSIGDISYAVSEIPRSVERLIRTGSTKVDPLSLEGIYTNTGPLLGSVAGIGLMKALSKL